MTNQKLHELIADGKFDLAQNRLKHLLDYDQDTGIFYWKNPISSRVVIGSIAGWSTSSGYVTISCDSKTYYAHRLAWLYVNGNMPKHQIDHINREKSDNRIYNLREASSSENSLNASRKHGKSKYKGVIGPTKYGTFEAGIMINQKHIRIGTFKTELDAAIAYDNYAISTGIEFILTNRDMGLLTYEQSLLNPKKTREKTSKYKGVVYLKNDKKWRSSVKFKGKTIQIGRHNSEIEAAIAFDKWVDENKDCKSKTNKSLGLLD